MAFEPTREGQLTEDKLNWGYWWVTHKVQVRRNFSIFLMLVDLLLVGYAAFGFLDYYYGSGVPERAQLAQMARQLTNYASFRQARAPQPLLMGSVDVLDAGEKAFDLAASVTNPNMGYWVDFDYQFASGGSAVGPVKHDFILPGATKYIHDLGVKSESSPNPAELQLANVGWHRVNAHLIRPDLATWAGIRLNFRIDNSAFKAPAPSDQLTVSRATFDFKNDTGFGYRRLGFFVALTGQAGLVGVNYVTVSDVRPGEVRTVDASWFSDLPSVTAVEVTPDVNIFDDKVYIPPGE